MSDLEAQLRDLGHASTQLERRADIEAWHDIRSRLDGAILDVRPTTLEPARTTRPLRLVAVAAVAAVLVLAVLAARTRTRSSSELAPASDGSVSRVLLLPVPDGYAMTLVQDDSPTNDKNEHVVILRSTAGPVTVMTLRSFDGVSGPVSGPDVAAVSIGTLPGGLLTPDALNAQLIWNDGTVTYQLAVAGVRAADRAFVLDVAGRVARNGTTAADVSLTSLPTGFEIGFSGPGAQLEPGGGWTIGYSNQGRNVMVSVGPRGLPAEQLAAVYDFAPVQVSGRHAFVGTKGPDPAAPGEPAAQILVLDLSETARLTLNGSHISRKELVALAARLRSVDEATWQAAVPRRLGQDTTTTGATSPPRSSPDTTVDAVDSQLRLTETYVARPDMDPATPCACNWRIEPLPSDMAAAAPLNVRVSVDGVIAVKFGQFSGFGEANQPVTGRAWIIIRQQTLTPSCPPMAPDATTQAPACHSVDGWSVMVVADEPGNPGLAEEDHGGLPAPTLR